MSGENERYIEEIITGIADFKIIPFFGSGMSAVFGMKTWPELIDILRTELGTDTTNFLDVAQEYEERFGKTALNDLLRSEVGEVEFNDIDMQVHYQILAMSPPIIYTTNWDKGIETASEKIKRKYFKISSLEDIVNAPHYSNVIVKYHGDFDHPENIVFTRNSYQERMAIEHPLDIIFRAHILGKGVLFLGYSFSDENIDLIFSRHNMLYATDLLPKSYIIAFRDDYDERKANALREKNVITIVLESREELSILINKVSQSVFLKSSERQTMQMFKRFPSLVLLDSELEHLKAYIQNASFTEEQKADKLEKTLQGKELNPTIEDAVASFLIEQLNVGSFEIKKSILLSYNEIRFRNKEHVLNIGIELIDLTKYDELNYSLREMTPIDTMSFVERRLEHNSTCIAVFFYLLRDLKERNTVIEPQLRRIFEKLRDCEWEKLGDVGAELTVDHQNHILNHFIRKFPGSAGWFDEPMLGRRLKTRSELFKEGMRMLPQSLKNFGTQLE